MFKLTQETVPIVTVGLARAGLVTTSDNAVRSEMQAMRAEARAGLEIAIIRTIARRSMG